MDEKKDMPLRRGVHAALEAAANLIIFESLKEVKRHSENDVLTPWKEKDRRKREIYVSSGVPDSATRQGNFHRAINSKYPELNSRDGAAPPRKGESAKTGNDR